MRIGILALQGNVRDHARVLKGLDVETVSVKQPKDIEHIDGLILPGGESTTMRKLLDSSGLQGAVTTWIRSDRPTMGTCAGLILMAQKITGDQGDGGAGEGLAVTVERNGYGPQRFSFEARVSAPEFGAPFEAVFIRAPRIVRMEPGVTKLGSLEENDEVVLCQQGSLLGCAFHPELSNDPRLHQYFIDLVASSGSDG